MEGKRYSFSNTLLRFIRESADDDEIRGVEGAPWTASCSYSDMPP